MGIFVRFSLMAVAIALLSGLMLYVIARGVLTDRFEVLDRQRAEDALQRLKVSLWHRLESCDSLAVDWARWDAVCDYIEYGDLRFEEENIVAGVFEDQGVDLLAILDAQGEMVYCGIYDLFAGRIERDPPVWVSALEKSPALWRFEGPADGAIGCWNSPAGPVLLSARPVLTSEGEGPVRGSLLFGRSLDEDELLIQGAAVGLDLQLSDVRPPEEAVLAVIDDDFYRALLPVPAVDDGMAVAIAADVPREVRREGLATLRIFAWLAVGLVVALALLLLAALHLALARPVHHLMGAVQRLAGGDLTARVPVDGHDELARLAEAVNGMAAAIATGQAHLQQALSERDMALGRANRELAASEERYRVIFEHTGSATCIVDRQGRIQLINEVFEELFGYARDEVEGRCNWRDFVFDDDQAETEAFIRSCFADPAGGRAVMEIRNRCRDGRVIWTAVTLASLPDGDRAVASLIDVTGLRHSQQALLRNEQLAAVGTLADGVAHEFNNINASIQMGVQLVLQNESIPERARGLLADVGDAARHGKRIAENLLGFAGAGAGVRRAQRLDQIAKRTVDIVHRTFAIAGIQLRCTLEACPLSLLDETQVGQVILNLLLNARDAVADSERPRIELACGTDDRGTWLSVRDNGCGIDEGHQTRIFDPFYSTKGLGGAGQHGTGLGLSIVHSVIRAHGGEIRVESQVGEGSVFTVHLPVAQRSEDDETQRLLKRALEA